MELTPTRHQILDRINPFIPKEISHESIVDKKSKGEYIRQIFPYLLTAIITFIGFFVSVKCGFKYWSHSNSVKIRRVRLGRRLGPTHFIPWNIFKAMSLSAGGTELRSYIQNDDENRHEQKFNSIVPFFVKLMSVCRKGTGRKEKSQNFSTIVNLFGIVEVRRKNSAAENAAKTKHKNSQPKYEKSRTPISHVTKVIKRWDDILQVLFSV